MIDCVLVIRWLLPAAACDCPVQAREALSQTRADVACGQLRGWLSCARLASSPGGARCCPESHTFDSVRGAPRSALVQWQHVRVACTRTWMGCGPVAAVAGYAMAHRWCLGGLNRADSERTWEHLAWPLRCTCCGLLPVSLACGIAVASYCCLSNQKPATSACEWAQSRSWLEGTYGLWL